MSKLPPETRAKSSLLANIPRLFDVSGVPEHELPTVNGHQTQSPLANAGADLSGRPKVWFVVGRGRIGKTTLSRWAAETADRTDADFVSVAADPTNRSLRDFRSVAEPPANDPAETASWLLSIISALKAEKASGFVDLGGGDTALRRMLDIEPDLCETMERDGLAPVAVYVLGPDDHDLESVRILHKGLQSFLSMRRMDARRRKARALWLRFSQSLASRRHRPSQPMVRSTIQRMGSTTKPLA